MNAGCIDEIYDLKPCAQILQEFTQLDLSELRFWQARMANNFQLGPITINWPHKAN